MTTVTTLHNSHNINNRLRTRHSSDSTQSWLTRRHWLSWLTRTNVFGPPCPRSTNWCKFCGVELSLFSCDSRREEGFFSWPPVVRWQQLSDTRQVGQQVAGYTHTAEKLYRWDCTHSFSTALTPAGFKFIRLSWVASSSCSWVLDIKTQLIKDFNLLFALTITILPQLHHRLPS